MEEEVTRVSRKKKYLAVGGAVLLTVLVLLLVALQRLDAWAEQKLKKQVATQSKGLYSLTLAKVDISLLAGSVSLDSLRLAPNDTVWKQLQQKTPAQAPASLSEVAAAKVQVRGIPFLKILFGGDIQVSALHLHSPDWTLRQMKKDTTSQPLHETLGEKFRKLAIREIKIEKGGFRFKNNPDTKTALYWVKGVEVLAKGVRLDSSSYHDPSRAFYSQEISASLQEASFFLPGGDYQVKSGPVKASTEKKELAFARLRLLPLRSAGEMSRKAGQAVTRFRVQVPEVRLGQVEFGTMFRHSNVVIGSLVAQKPQVNAYKDSKHYRTKGKGLMPHDVVQQLPFGLNVRTAKVRDMYVRYEELSEKAFKTGYVTGSNIDLTLTNLTNDKNLISAKRPAILKGSGYLMGKALMQATVRLALLDPNGYHSIEGTIGKGYPAILNPMVEPSMFVRVKSGFLQRGSFKVELTKTSATGHMQLQYDDFKIDLLNKEKEEKQSLGNKIKSLVANKLVLKSESEEDGKAPREGAIQVKRRPERSFLTYWKDCLANGVLSIIGAPM
ncbi:hypothetical protein ACD591_14805 [Rufibacter glacialis]|uniref:DUF748 domain-containing protein n=1 Tax=Rufibacter glacialis TaxID=1259555 RepID=A0A5M8QNW5_9BACT|nr:hypothetical protein [Rufibacter glacialis]KAA6437769.1 hypothetical protein FOE74_04520 [Rufibacter glacialis]GGK56438.1 hypothetical protein GCM10011405_00710 [Rufibacter glacialis]